jgi:hypothetical protein
MAIPVIVAAAADTQSRAIGKINALARGTPARPAKKAHHVRLQSSSATAAVAARAATDSAAGCSPPPAGPPPVAGGDGG